MVGETFRNSVKSSEANLYVLKKDHQKLIQIVFDYFQKEGEWPKIRLVASKIKGDSVPKIRDSLPRSLYIPDRKLYKITLFGIFHAKGCDVYKRAISDIANILIKIIDKNPEKDKAIITEKEISYFPFVNNSHKEKVFWMLGEPFGGGYGVSEDSLSIDIPNDPLRINSFTDPIDFVKLYYAGWDELLSIEKDNNITQKIISEDDKYFDMTFLSSKNRREIVSRYIKEAEIAFNNNASMASVILYGASLECVLLDILIKRSSKVKKKIGKNVKNLRFEEMIDIAHDFGLISTSSKDLGHSLRDYRNLVHPERCQREKLPTRNNAKTARHVFTVIIEELKKKKKSKKS